MKQDLWSKIKREGIWLSLIVLGAVIAEYIFLLLYFENDPVISIKVQVLIGLLLFGYVIRVVARLWPSEDNGNGPSGKTGVNIDRDRF